MVDTDKEKVSSEDRVHDLEAGAEQVFFDVLVSGDEASVRTLMAELHPADAADLLERLGTDERAIARSGVAAPTSRWVAGTPDPPKSAGA